MWLKFLTQLHVLSPLLIPNSGLKDVPFWQHEVWGLHEPKNVCADHCNWVIGEKSSVPYGDASVINFSDLSGFEILIVTTSEGEPRFLFNRDEDEGQWNEIEADSHLIDNTKGGWSSKYFSQDGNTFIVDIRKMVNDKGYAHLHAIKGANWEDIIVESMVLRSDTTLSIASSLQDVPFWSHEDWGLNEPMSNRSYNCQWVIGEKTGTPYGDGLVRDFSDLSGFEKLIVTMSEGEPRFLFNRDEDEGQWNEVEADSHLIDNTKGGWSSKYFSQDGNVFTVDIKKMLHEEGYAHLHAIKSANWNEVIVESMVLTERTKPLLHWTGVWQDSQTEVNYVYNDRGEAYVQAGQNDRIAGSPNASGDITICPHFTVDGKEFTVVGIGDYAFANNKNITTVSIPEEVFHIGDAAFQDCI